MNRKHSWFPMVSIVIHLGHWQSRNQEKEAKLEVLMHRANKIGRFSKSQHTFAWFFRLFIHRDESCLPTFYRRSSQTELEYSVDALIHRSVFMIWIQIQPSGNVDSAKSIFLFESQLERNDFRLERFLLLLIERSSIELIVALCSLVRCKTSFHGSLVFALCLRENFTPTYLLSFSTVNDFSAGVKSRAANLAD